MAQKLLKHKSIPHGVLFQHTSEEQHAQSNCRDRKSFKNDVKYSCGCDTRFIFNR